MICRRTSQSRPGLGRTVPDGATEYSQALAEQVTINEDGFLKPDGNRINAQVDYEYDDLYRLVHEHRIAYNGGNSGVAYEYNFVYDAAGNRTAWEVVGVGTTYYTYDAANKMLTAGDSTLTYDIKGNTLTETNGSIVATYTWDYLNRLTQWTKTGETTQAYVYNGYSMRVGKTNGGTTTSLLMGSKEIAEEITGSNTTSYVGFGLDGTIADTTRTISYADGIGSIRATSNATQEVTSVAIYDAYGNVQSGYATASPFGYVGLNRYYTDGPELVYVKARYYNPTHGRFLSRDPVGFRGGQNLYEYVYSRPTNLVDPNGTSPNCAICIGCISITAGYLVAGCMDGCRGATCYWDCVAQCLKDTALNDDFWKDLPFWTQIGLGACAGTCISCGIDLIPGPTPPGPPPTEPPVPPRIIRPGDPDFKLPPNPIRTD